MDQDSPDDRALWGVKHLNDFIGAPGNYWALSTGLDGLNRHWLRGQLSPSACAELLRAIEGAEETSLLNPDAGLGEVALERGFKALLLLARAWGADEAPGWLHGVAVLGSRQDPRLRDARRYARILQNCAHNLSLLQ